MTTVIVTGTDTGVGKTVFSAGLTAALGAQYWKPVQSGLEEETDSQIVARFLKRRRQEIFHVVVEYQAGSCFRVAQKGLEEFPGYVDRINRKGIIPDEDRVVVSNIKGIG